MRKAFTHCYYYMAGEPEGVTVMKLIFAVIRDEDAGKAVKKLNENRFSVTKLMSTGGFLRSGNTTLMIGIDDENVEAVMDILKEECAKRSEIEIAMPYMPGGVPMMNYSYVPIKAEVGGATVFVVDVCDFRKV